MARIIMQLVPSQAIPYVDDAERVLPPPAALAWQQLKRCLSTISAEAQPTPQTRSLHNLFAITSFGFFRVESARPMKMVAKCA
jgi:hypothetical protein